MSRIGAYKSLQGLANAMENAMELRMPPAHGNACIVCFNKQLIKLITLN